MNSELNSFINSLEYSWTELIPLSIQWVYILASDWVPNIRNLDDAFSVVWKLLSTIV